MPRAAVHASVTPALADTQQGRSSLELGHAEVAQGKGIPPPLAGLRRLETVAGFMYVLLSVGAQGWFVYGLFPHLANDMWWPDFNATGAQTLLGDLFNLRLGTYLSPDFDVVAPSNALVKDYSTPWTVLGQSPAYPRSIVLESTTNLEDIIRGIRGSPFRASFQTLVQYCWVDLDKRFEMANTAARQARCRVNDGDNAAVHLETILRNIRWADLTSEYGGDGGVFDLAIGAGVRELPGGTAWLASVQDAFVDVTSEAALWRAKNATRWELPWHNAWQPGVEETIRVENALGLSQHFTIKAFLYEHRGSSWKSIVLYYGLWNDLTLAMQTNRSMVRNTSRFSPDESVYPVYAGASLSSVPALLWQMTVGPFGSTDAKLVVVPSSLGKALLAFEESLAAACVANATLWRLVQSIPRARLVYPLPSAWTDRRLAFLGASPLCPPAPAMTGLQELFGFEDSCLRQERFAIQWTTQSLGFARWGVHVMSNGAWASSTATCALANPTSTSTCLRGFEAGEMLVQAAQSPSTSRLDVDAMRQAVRDVKDVRVIQFGLNASSRQLLFLQQPLVASADLAWSFFGWTLLFDWASQLREVVRFEGGSSPPLTLISRLMTLQSMSPRQVEIPTSGARYVQFVTIYTTAVLAAVAAVLLGYAASARLDVLGRNLFRFNRVAGFVWVGRTVLLVRGITAVVYLSTSNVSMVNANGLVHFAWRPHSVPTLLVITGEATWISYVVQDVVVAFLSEYAYFAAPVGALLSWGLLFAANLLAPMRATATLARSCTTIVLARQVSCVSGTVEIGQARRVVVQVGGQVAVTALVFALAVAFKWRRKLLPTSLLIAGASAAYLDFGRDQTATKALEFDCVSCAMSGILTCRVLHTTYVFDVKSWTVRAHRVERGRRLSQHLNLSHAPTVVLASAHDPASPPSLTHRFRKKDRAMALIGLVYMLTSLATSVVYIFATRINLANDFWWASFNSSGVHTFLGNWYTRQLLGNADPTNILSTLHQAKYGDLAQYNTTTTFVSTSDLHVKTIQHDVVSALSTAIAGLRRMDACFLPWVMTSYCWLDLNQSFPMANTAARQRRCHQRYADNGAVYMETALRNVNLPDLLSCSGADFDIAFRSHLATSSRGQQWLDAVDLQQSAMTSLDDEERLWRSAGITHYTTQFQNYKHLGLVATFSIQNAFGMSYPMTIQSSQGGFDVAIQTSYKLYWGFGNDLDLVSANASTAFGRSLIATSGNFAFANATMEQYMTANLVVTQPFHRAYVMLRRVLGPFGSIDAHFVTCPGSLRTLVQDLTDSVVELLGTDHDVQDMYTNMQFLSVWQPCPRVWFNVSRLPGNFLCQPAQATPGSTAIAALWGSGGCGAASEVIVPSKVATIMATILTAKTNVSVAATCANERRSPTACVPVLEEARALVDRYVPATATSAFVAAGVIASAAIAEQNVSLLQFSWSTGAPLTLPLFHSADFDFFSWGFAFDWTMARREVVSFEGDNGTLVLVSTTSFPIATPPSAAETPVNLALYMRGCVVYVTSLLAFVAGLATLFILTSRGRIEGLNMFEINRVGGMVWAGRPLLFIRSMVAIGLLSTATLELRQQGIITTFHVDHLEWYKIILASGEVGWFVYVVGDILIVATHAYTMTYGVIGSVLAWAVAAIVSVRLPVTHSVRVHRVCDVVDVDFQLSCDAGTVYIGSSTRFAQLIVICVGCMAVSYAFERWRRPRLKDTRANVSLLLSAAGRYYFALDEWKHADCVYLDKASAVISGVICVQGRRRFYLLDIKLWRTFVVPIPDTAEFPTDHGFHDRARHAFPLFTS